MEVEQGIYSGVRCCLRSLVPGRKETGSGGTIRFRTGEMLHRGESAYLAARIGLKKVEGKSNKFHGGGFFSTIGNKKKSKIDF